MATNQLKTRITADASQFNRVVGRLGRTVGAAAAGIGGAALGASLFSVKQAVSFEKKMAEVFTLLGNPPEALRKQLTEDIRGLSTEFGQAKEELASGLYATISAGIPADNAIDFLTTGVKTAVAAVTDTETAIKGLVGIINAYRLSSEDAEAISDKLFTTVKLGSTNYSLMADSLGKSNASANALGVGLDEMLASFVAIVGTEMDTARATTMLGAVMSSLATPSEDLAARFKKLGVATAEELIQTHGLVGGLKLLTKESGTTLTAVSELFGEKRASSGIIALLAENKLPGYMAEIGTAAGSQGVAFDIMAATTAHSLALMKQDFLSTAERMGTTLLPAVKELATSLQETLNDPDVQEGIKSLFSFISFGAKKAADGITKLTEEFNKLAAIGRAMEEKMTIKNAEGEDVGIGDAWANWVEYSRRIRQTAGGFNWRQPVSGSEMQRARAANEPVRTADLMYGREMRAAEIAASPKKHYGAYGPRPVERSTEAIILSDIKKVLVDQLPPAEK